MASNIGRHSNIDVGLISGLSFASLTGSASTSTAKLPAPTQQDIQAFKHSTAATSATTKGAQVAFENGSTYSVKKQLGQGAFGSVSQVSSGGSDFALKKISVQSNSELGKND